MSARQWLMLALQLAMGALLLLPQGSVADPSEDHSEEETEEWVSEKDYAASAATQVAIGEFCAEGGEFKGEVDEERGRQIMEGVGGQNVILDIMKGAKSTEELSEKAGEQITPQWMIVQAAPIIFAILLAVWWWCCCWTACPGKYCCQCCRLCRKKRPLGVVCKFGVLIIALILILGILISAFVALTGYSTSVDGFDNLACTSAKLIEGVLDGKTDEPKFIGMIPLLNDFSELEKQLSPNSALLTDVGTIINSTQVITDSVIVATEVMKLLGEILGSQMPPVINDNKHDCKFCSIVGDSLITASGALEGGLGSTLSEARKEIEKQLTGTAVQQLQSQVSAGAEPLIQVKVMVRDTFSFFTDVDKFGQLKAYVNREVAAGCSLIILCAFLLMLCMGISVFSFTFFDKCGGEPNKHIHRCACMTWCCGWNYAVFAFFLGGILNAIGGTVSGMCLIMDDMNSDMLMDIGPAIGLDLEGDQGDMIVSIMDNCFLEGANSALLDLVKVDDNGTQVTMMDKFVVQTRDTIKSKFNDISAFGDSFPSLANQSMVLELLEMLTHPIDQVILPDGSYDFVGDANYSAMFVDDRPGTPTEPNLTSVFISSVRCIPGSVSAKISDALASMTPPVSAISPVQDIEASLLGLGGASAGIPHACANTVDCSDGTSTGVQIQVCEAGNKYMLLKRGIMDAATYRCDVFVDPVNNLLDCDPADMATSDGGLTWTGDCLWPDGKMVRRQKDCTLADFVIYVAAYSDKMRQTLERVDNSTAAVITHISVELFNVVDEHVLQPLTTVAEGVTCGFMGEFYRNVVNGLCYQGIVGFQMMAVAYIFCAVFAIFITILMYTVWRATIDNYNDFVTNKVAVAPDS